MNDGSFNKKYQTPDRLSRLFALPNTPFYTRFYLLKFNVAADGPLGSHDQTWRGIRAS
jgi:hypothetical protein